MEDRIFLNRGRSDNKGNKKDEDDKKTKKKLIGFTENEFIRVQNKAKDLGLDVASYIRFAALNCQVDVGLKCNSRE